MPLLDIHPLELHGAPFALVQSVLALEFEVVFELRQAHQLLLLFVALFVHALIDLIIKAFFSQVVHEILVYEFCLLYHFILIFIFILLSIFGLLLGDLIL